MMQGVEMNRERRATNLRLRAMTACTALLLAGAAMLGGCASSGIKMSQPGQSAVNVTEKSEAKLPDGKVTYTVAPLDVLQVDVYPERSSSKLHRADFDDEILLQLYFTGSRYRIAPGDTLSVELPDESDKVYNLPVLPDGKIHLPLNGHVVVAVGKTPTELTALLDRAYASLLRNPHVIVNVIKSGLDNLQHLSTKYTVDSDGQIVMPLLGSFHVLGKNTFQIKTMVFERAKKYFHNSIDVAAAILPVKSQQVDNSRLTADEQGHSTVDEQDYFHGKVTVSPDGSIFVPDAGSFAAQGKSLSKLNQDLQSAFDRVYQNKVQVNVALVAAPSMSVYIGGEVAHPGRYPYEASLTLLQLIASAGWVNNAADISKTVLLHATADNRYTRYQTNLTEVVDGKTVLKQDIRVSPKDIIIVPKSGIEDVDQWVDQYIRRLLPFNTSVNYTAIKNNAGSIGALIK